MRVLIVHTYYKQRGGEDSVVENEIELLKSNGVNVEFLRFYNEEQTLLKFLQSPFNYHSYKRTLKILKDFKPDVVHIHNLHFSGSSAVIYAIRKMHIPVVMTLHNYRLVCPSASLFFDGQPFFNSLQGGFAWQAIRKGVYQGSKLKTFWLAVAIYFQQKSGILNAVNQFILLGEHSKEIFLQSPLKHLANRLVIKPNFSAKSPEQVTIPPVTNFLFIGRLTEEKGICVLLKAFEGSKNIIKIVGTGPLAQMVTESAKKNKNIEFLGEQNRENINLLLSQCSALIFPSIWFETFGMVIIEAFSKGKPVIASNLGNISNLVQDGYNGLLFTPGSAEDLKGKIDSFNNLSEDGQITFGCHAKKSHELLYTPQENLLKLFKIYKDAIASK